MGRFKVKLERTAQGNWCATLYEDPLNKPLKDTGLFAIGSSREAALDKIRRMRDNMESAPEPEWVSLDDETPEPQSIRAV